jgi:hypothetical protein
MKHLLPKLALYGCATHFLIFGFLKLMHAHFYGLSWEAFRNQYSLNRLPFFYFSAAPAYLTLIGGFEWLAGACLILGKWRGFGFILGLAIQTNICLINICYGFGILVTTYNCLVGSVLFMLSFPFLKKIHDIHFH